MNIVAFEFIEPQYGSMEFVLIDESTYMQMDSLLFREIKIDNINREEDIDEL